MSDRRGVVMVMFDLPVREREERRRYTQFRKAIRQRGYGYFQRSVYIKLLRNISGADREIRWLDSIAPEDGSVRAVAMNLNVFRGLTAVRGTGFNMSLFADDLVFIGDGSPEDAPEMEDSEMLRRCEELMRRHKRELGEESGKDADDDDDAYVTDLF